MSTKDWISSALALQHVFFIFCEPTQVNKHQIRGCLPFVTLVGFEMLRFHMKTVLVKEMVSDVCLCLNQTDFHVCLHTWLLLSVRQSGLL